MLSLQRMMVQQTNWRSRLRCFRYWARRYVDDGRGPSDEDREFVESSRQSDAIVLGTDVSAQRFKRFLAARNAGDLDGRVVVVPFTVGASFFSCPIQESRDDCVVAMGRWDDPQKDVELLIRTVSRFAALRPSTRVVIMGSGAEACLQSLSTRIPQVAWAGPSTQETVAQHLASSRVLFFSSRWEGCPHSAIEAMVLGSTLVGPPIPALESWCGDQEFGTLSSSRRPSALAKALASECERWDNGRRDPREISSHWRSKCAPEVVCADLLAAAGL
jgi:glycosyltransferase involved in cell wall biosynthesis